MSNGYCKIILIFVVSHKRHFSPPSVIRSKIMEIAAKCQDIQQNSISSDIFSVSKKETVCNRFLHTVQNLFQTSAAAGIRP